MTWDEFKAALDELSLSQAKFSRLLEMQSPVGVNKWRHKPHVPGYAAVIVALMLAIRRDAQRAGYPQATLADLMKKAEAGEARA